MSSRCMRRVSPCNVRLLTEADITLRDRHSRVHAFCPRIYTWTLTFKLSESVSPFKELPVHLAENVVAENAFLFWSHQTSRTMTKIAGANGGKVSAVVVACRNLKALELDGDSVKVGIVEQLAARVCTMMCCSAKTRSCAKRIAKRSLNSPR